MMMKLLIMTGAEYMKKTKASPQVVIKDIVIIVEGDTEVEFYKLVKDHIKADKVKELGENYFKNHYAFEKIVNLHGIGNFQKDAKEQFDKIREKNDKKISKLEEQGKNVAFEYHIFLCIDTDVFEYDKNPPLDKEKLKKDLLNSGEDVVEVSYIEAKKSIEDWFLDDLDGIKKFLKLKSIPKGYKSKSTGYEKLKHIFKNAGKSYVKGNKVEGFVKKLNVPSIIKKHQKELKSLWDAIK